MFIDEAQITVKAARGGDGAASFRREKYVPRGGPDGGDGGKGGDVILEVKPDMRTLLDFKYRSVFKAGKGRQGSGKKRTGKDGEDCIVPVPPGTVVYDLDLDRVVADLVAPGQRLIAARGGKGGRGNSSFATPSRQAPRFRQRGAPGEERRLRLELKLLADVGIIGYPNVGKSTLISHVSAAKPEIAPYPFTTLQPNLGVVKFEDHTSFVIADLPGLIAGAHEGVGLGHQFLRHIERTRLLVHMLDVAAVEGRDPLQDRLDINRELQLHDEKLSSLEQVMALNKIDLLPLQRDRENVAHVREVLEAEGLAVFPISAATGEGVQELVNHLRERLALSEQDEEVETPAEMVIEIPPLPRRELRVQRLSNDVLAVSGTRIENLAATTDLQAAESLAWFQQQLEEQGVTEFLRKAGAREGDTVVIGDIEFEYSEAAFE